MTYSIAIDGFAAATGTTKLNWAFVPAPTLAVNDVSVKEGNKGTTTATFTISRVGMLTTASSIDYKTVNGTATAGKDYVAVPLNTVTFAAGERTKAVTVKIQNDKKREKREAFYLSLSGATGATILDARGKATVVDND